MQNINRWWRNRWFYFISPCYYTHAHRFCLWSSPNERSFRTHSRLLGGRWGKINSDNSFHEHFLRTQPISCGPNPRTANWLENGYLHLHPQVTDDFKFHSTKSVDSHEQSVCFGGEGEMGICCLGEISKNWFLPPPMGVPFCCNKYCYIGRGSLLNPIHCDYLPGWTVSGRHHSVAWQAKKQGELKKWLGHLFM